MKRCPWCAEEIKEAAVVCKHCGRDLASPPAGYPAPHFGPPPVLPYPSSPGDDAVMRMILPVGRSGWAIAAGYLGLFSLLLIPAPLALLCGIIAVRDIQERPNLHGMGRAVFGIVCGAVGSIALLVVATS